MAFPWGAVAAGGSGIAGPIISGMMNSAAARTGNARDLTLYFLQNADNYMRWQQENEYSEKVWNMQNRYNEQMWHMMNEYNSPMNQMKRFKEAGLNPNLIYGQSNTAPAIATGNFQNNKYEGAQAKASRIPTWDFTNVNPMEDIMRFKSQAAQVSNLEEQSKVLQQEQLKKAAEVQNIQTNTAIGKENLDVIKKTSLQAATLGIEKTQRDIASVNASIDKSQEETRVLKNRDEREAAQNAASISEAYQRIANMRNEQVTQKLQQQLMMLDLELKSLGIQPTDGLFMRILGRALKGESVPSIIDNLTDKPAFQFNNFFRK